MNIKSFFIIFTCIIFGISQSVFADTDSPPSNTTTAMIAIGGAAVVGGGVIAALHHHSNNQNKNIPPSPPSPDPHHITPGNDPVANGNLLVADIAAVAAAGGGSISLGSGTYAVSGTLDIPPGVTLIGSIGDPSSVIITATSTSVTGCSGAISFATLKIASDLIIFPSASCAASVTTNKPGDIIGPVISIGGSTINFNNATIVNQPGLIGITFSGNKMKVYSGFNLAQAPIAAPKRAEFRANRFTFCPISDSTESGCSTNVNSFFATDSPILASYSSTDNQFYVGANISSSGNLLTLAEDQCKFYTQNSTQATPQQNNTITYFNAIPDANGAVYAGSCLCASSGSQDPTPTCDSATALVDTPVKVSVVGDDKSVRSEAPIRVKDDPYSEKNIDIVDCKAGSGTCSASYFEKPTIILTKTTNGQPDNTSLWGADCASFGTEATCSLTANNLPLYVTVGPTYTLTINNIQNNGAVTLSPLRESCSAHHTCNYTFSQNATITLTNTDGAWNNFGGFCQGYTPGSAVCIIHLTSNQNVSAL